ncbi:hypothetical protein A1F94_005981 [Pyrenophora tritici-repentis]|uniref:Uncharacterized protein n=2 Tax=Pyrenophora tritici-repentis TaxID=45151 RepID=A0A5M9L5P9_9PLEO|nr:uncharacterized protein PTRG_05451 [Pyrenophora tritici-repentis Pt-1C-BFP]KAA8618516.1 hypothetical protein PtrV1_07945 [Pyrenophora tritici-repentis]EDU48371.1 predicted protein [Pyrenophora tritici-repentis Pt-1C-BFP]KAF7448989.1 hypothetical protein A1F99_060380 [Pyrenophora tritici-repentis]KAF7571017.1 hypothetical protein PtrM4_110190 [Pyrenophora tritici-repentis]KAG9384070.1 hypothetical protein A1F94_005981 [Pyrenophora tritici-repentis]
MKSTTLIPLFTLILGASAYFTCQQDKDASGQKIDPFEYRDHPGYCVGHGGSDEGRSSKCDTTFACYSDGNGCTPFRPGGAYCGKL